MKWLPKHRPKRSANAKAPKRDSAVVLALRDEAMTRRWERLYAMKDLDFEDRVRDVVIDTLIEIGLVAEPDDDDDKTLPPEALPGVEPPRSLN